MPPVTLTRNGSGETEKYRTCQGSAGGRMACHKARAGRAARQWIGTRESAVERRGSAMRGNTLVRVRHRNAVRRERLDLRRVPCAIVPCTAWPLDPLGWFALAWDGHRLPHICTIVNIFFAKMCRKFSPLLLQQFVRRPPCVCRPVPP